MHIRKHIQCTAVWATLATALCMSSGAHAATYYISPSGNDAAAGTSTGSPWRTFGHAVGRLDAGDTLRLKDGTYTAGGTGLPHINCRGGASNGTSAQPITIAAQHERKAHLINGHNRPAFYMRGCRYWKVDGLFVEGKDDPGGVNRTFGVIDSRHIEISRLLGYKNNRYTNSAVVEIIGSKHVLVEEAEVYKFHRNGISAFQSEFVTVRRSYLNSRGYADLPDGRDSHGLSRDGGDAAATMYYSSNSIIENSISEHKNEGFGLGASGKPTAFGHPSGRNNKLLGSVSLGDNKGGGFGSTRHMPGDPLSAGADGLVENYLIVNPIKIGMTARAVLNLRVRNVTVYKRDPYVEWRKSIVVNGNRQVSGASTGTVWPACAEIGGCGYDFKNILISTRRGSGFTFSDGANGYRVSYSNVYADAFANRDGEIDDREGSIRHSSRVNPQMGVAAGQCVAYVPDDSPMKGAGEGGADIGANVMYRYIDGQQTDEPLWKGGAFPCGAVVAGVNDRPDDSCSGVHRRLNIGTGGCPLPDGYLDDGPTHPQPEAHGPHTFAIQGEPGGRAWWTVRSSGHIWADELNSEDEITDGQAKGIVAGGRDAVSLDGGLDFVDITGAARVWIDGVLVRGGDPDQYHTLVVQGIEPATTDYHFRVYGGLDGRSLDAADDIDHNFATGEVWEGKDVFTFRGGLNRIDMSGSAQLYYDGDLIRDGRASDGSADAGWSDGSTDVGNPKANGGHVDADGGRVDANGGRAEADVESAAADDGAACTTTRPAGPQGVGGAALAVFLVQLLKARFGRRS